MQKFKSLPHVKKHANALLCTTFKYMHKSICLDDYGYSFKWRRSMRVFGRCNVKNKIIYLSYDITKENLDNVTGITNVLLHELAHAIEFELYGKTNHKKRFKAICKKIGGNGKSFFMFDGDEGIKRPLYKYHLKCPVCGFVYHKMRLTKTSKSCSLCSPTFDTKYLLQIIQNY